LRISGGENQILWLSHCHLVTAAAAFTPAAADFVRASFSARYQGFFLPGYQGFVPRRDPFVGALATVPLAQPEHPFFR